MSSESATIQILFPSEEESAFEPYQPSAGARAQGESRVSPMGFESSEAFWRAVRENPALKEEFEKELERRVEARITEQNKSVQEKIFNEARSEGLALGQNESNKKAESVNHAMETAVSSLLADREVLIRSHEAEWSKAFIALTNQMLVPRQAEFLEAVQSWLDRQIREVTDTSLVKVYVSPESYELISKAQKTEVRYQFFKDASLTKSETRFEIGGEGTFFSSERLNEGLKRIISQYFSIDEGEKE